MSKDYPSGLNTNQGEEVIKLVFRGLLPIFLMIGGMLLLFLRISGWSIILGLPMLIMGTVFLIYTYDEVVQRRVEPIRGQITKCSICHKFTPMMPGIDKNQTVCPKCLEEGR